MSAYAVPPLTLGQLQADCQAVSRAPDSAPAQRCLVYVQGFLDGAVATDERVALNVAEEIERSETLTERAIRTRLGVRLSRVGASFYAEYCVGDPVPVQEVVGHVIEELEVVGSDPTALARDVVYAALRRHYPCAE
jgi:hypothetical protein